MIKYVKGDLLDATQNLIAHSCNMQGVMGSGVAKAIKDKYPSAFASYRSLLYHGEAKLGEYCIAKNEDKIIINILGQDKYYPRNIRHTSYDALDLAFKD